MENNPDQKVQDDATHRKRKRSPNTDMRPTTDRNSHIQERVVSQGLEEATVQASSKRPRDKSGSPTIIGDIPDTYQKDHMHTQTHSLVDLPVEILQHILCHVDPFCLGRVMCVNKYLHSLLDSRQELQRPSGFSMTLRLLKPESIWLRSRRACLLGIPPQLVSMTEYEMLKLTYGKRCQICSNLPKAPPNSTAGPWNSGPGPTGIRTIWPFRIRLCADCLRPLLQKESDPDQPGSPQLHIGLLSASFTPSLHYVMSMTLTQTPVPVGLQITKHYYRPQVEQLISIAPESHLIGTAAYEAFGQKLNEVRQEAIADTVRLEAWELSQKLANEMLTIPFKTMIRSSASGSSIQSDNITKSYFSTSSGGQRPHTTMSSRSGVGSSLISGQLSRNETGSQSYLSRTNENMIAQPQFAVGRPAHSVSQFRKVNHVSHSTSDQGSVDIVRLKAERRSDIQRRCMTIDPPLSFQDFERLPAIQTAIQSLMPLDDASWGRLKAQISLERSGLEASSMQTLDMPQNLDHLDTASARRAPTPVAEPPKIDFKEQAFRPVREKLHEIAREYVHRRYASGTGLTQNTAPQFAADVLLYVRQRFYEYQGLEDAAFREANQQPPDEGPSGIRTRTLKLEHMRHVFDTSIKPFTELVRKDLFLCRVCDTQGRYFAFEAVIQHFASKHTDTFSRGSAVVYWKAEWPADPPFEPRPGNDMNSAARTTHNLPVPEVFVPTVAQDSNRLQRDQDSIHADYNGSASAIVNELSGSSYDTSFRNELPQLEGRDTYVPVLWPLDRPTRNGASSNQVSRATQTNSLYRSGNLVVDDAGRDSYPPTSLLESRAVTDRRPHQQQLSPNNHNFYPQAHMDEDPQTMGTDLRQVESHDGRRPIYPGRTSYHQPEGFASMEANIMRRGRSYGSYRYDRSHNTEALPPREGRHPPQPRLSLHHEVHYGPPRYQAMVPNDHYLYDRGPIRDSSADATLTSGQHAAERFLASVDVPTTGAEIKHSPKPASTGVLSRPASREQIYSREAFVDHMTNSAQHRSYYISRSADDQDDTSVFSSQASQRRSSLSRPSIPHQSWANHREFVSAGREQYQVEHAVEIVDHPRIVHERDPYTGSDTGISRNYHNLQQPRYLDRYGRELDPRDFEVAQHPSYYQEVRETTMQEPYHVGDDGEDHGPYHHTSFEPGSSAWSPADQRGYVEQPIREYVPRPRYIEYEEPPARRFLREDEPLYHGSNYPSRHQDDGRYPGYRRR